MMAMTRAADATVIARLDRATQYAVTPAFTTQRLRLLGPRFRGDDNHV
jgi:hypothetical protein